MRTPGARPSSAGLWAATSGRAVRRIARRPCADSAIRISAELTVQAAVETNGTTPPPPGLDWICVSPKAKSDIVVSRGHELKLVFPQTGAEPERYEALPFEHFFLQPMDGPEKTRNTELAVRYCLEHPQWRLSLQTHKFLGIP